MVSFRLAPATLPLGQRVYAIGDIHGCVGQLTAMHDAICADLAERPSAQAAVVYLGDYIDRGPDSAGVIELIRTASLPTGTQRIPLMGNHEHMLLEALGDPESPMVGTWLGNGGFASLRSWGISPVTCASEWEVMLPGSHAAFLRSLDTSFVAGGYLFVHAGVRPGIPLSAQTTHDLLWIREPFLRSKADLGAVIVHGHTPRPDPEARSNRIGIDTGAVYGGPLTCAVLEDARIGFLQT